MQLFQYIPVALVLAAFALRFYVTSKPGFSKDNKPH